MKRIPAGDRLLFIQIAANRNSNNGYNNSSRNMSEEKKKIEFRNKSHLEWGAVNERGQLPQRQWAKRKRTLGIPWTQSIRGNCSQITHNYFNRFDEKPLIPFYSWHWTVSPLAIDSAKFCFHLLVNDIDESWLPSCSMTFSIHFLCDQCAIELKNWFCLRLAIPFNRIPLSNT